MGRVPHHGSPHADFQIDVTYGGSTIPMYVNVNVQSNNGSNDLVHVSPPTETTSPLPPDHTAHVFEDHQPGISYSGAGLNRSHFKEASPTEMVDLIHNSVEGGHTVAIWGQIYVVCFFLFLHTRIISHPRHHRTKIGTQGTSLREFMTSTPTLMMREKYHKQCYRGEMVLSKFTPLRTGTPLRRVGFISCFHRKNSATKACYYLRSRMSFHIIQTNRGSNGLVAED